MNVKNLLFPAPQKFNLFKLFNLPLPRSTKMLLRPVPQKFNIFNTFTTYAIFAKFANFNPALKYSTLIHRHASLT